jgi:hypothetical protein
MNLKSYKFIISILVFSACFTGIYFTSRKALDGFSEMKIHGHIEKSIKPLPEHLSDLYSKTFHYLGRGNQFYAFVSSDNKYVVKFIRFDHLKPKLLIRLLKYIPHSYIITRLERAHFLKKRLFDSIDCTLTYLSDITGTLHYQKNVLDKPLICFDKLNIMHKIQKAPFIVQHYSPKLESVLNQLDQDEIKVLIDEIITLQKRRFDLGIEDGDPKITTNFGFKDLKLTQIDIGQFSKVNHPFEKQARIARVRRILKRIRPQIENKYPKLSHYIENSLERL